jgi:uncharacterized protein
MIVDVHQHFGLTPVVSGAGISGLDDDRRQRLEFMDKWGIDQAFLLPSNASPSPDGLADRRESNSVIAKYVALQPDRFPAGMGTVHPADGQRGIDEISRCVETLGLRGIVWHHHFLGTPIDHPGMHAMLDRVEELNALAFIHIVAESALEAPWRLEILAEAHPQVTFVALDGFSSFSHATWITQIAKRQSNILFDTGMLASVAHQIRDFLEIIGPDRLLLGTDFHCPPQLFGSPFPLTEIRDNLDLSTAVSARVLGENALTLLDSSSRHSKNG